MSLPIQGPTSRNNTGYRPHGYAGPALQPKHPGRRFDNSRFTLSTTPQVILRGPVDPNGTRFVEGIFLKNWAELDAETNPTVVTIRLVTVPPDVYTSANEYPLDYVGMPEENLDEFGICQGGTECWNCCFTPLYLKGNQFLLAYIDTEGDHIKGITMYSEEV